MERMTVQVEKLLSMLIKISVLNCQCMKMFEQMLIYDMIYFQDQVNGLIGSKELQKNYVLLFMNMRNNQYV